MAWAGPNWKPVKGAAWKARQSARVKRERAFRLAVWVRAGHRCEACGYPVSRNGMDGTRVGHVHHLRGRNVAPEDRYNEGKAQLLCASCHAAKHHQHW